MLQPLSSLTSGQIAGLTAVGSLLAAIIGGSFALTAALVNVWAAGRIAKASRKREFRIQLIEPYLASLDAEVQFVRDHLMELTGLVSQSVSGAKPMVKELLDRAHTVRVAEVHTLTIRHRSLSKAVAAFNLRSNELDEWLRGLDSFLDEFPSSLDNWLDEERGQTFFKQLMQCLGRVVSEGWTLRGAIEDFIFD